MRNATIRVVKIFSLFYPLALVGVLLVFRHVGETWWVATVALYVPRIVFAAPLPFLLAMAVRLRLWRWLWTQAASLLLLLPLTGFVLPRTRTFDPHATTLRLLSYNVNSTAAGAEKIAAQIDEYSPDIVLLQEADHLDELQQVLGARYPTVHAGGQFVLASRYPLLSVSEPPRVFCLGKERSPRYRRYALDTPLGPLAVYNVHPISPREDFNALRGPEGFREEVLSGRVFSGNTAPLIFANAGLRGAQAHAIATDAAHEIDPVVIAGDTNLPELSRIFAETLAQFDDGFSRAGWGFGYTFPNGRRPAWMRIDRILTSELLRVVGFEVGMSSASDHRCVVADIQRARP